MVDPLRAERDATLRKLQQARAQPQSHDPLAVTELALGVAVFDHAIDLFTRLPAQQAVGHIRACQADPCPQFGAYALSHDRASQIVSATLTRALELWPTVEDPPAPHLRMRGGQPWTEAMTTAWFTPTAPDRPQDLPSGIAVPSRRTRHLAHSAIAAFLEHRDQRGCDEEQARQQAITTVLQAEANRERRPERPLATGDGTRWTEMMSRALFDLRAPDRPTDLPWNLAVPPQRTQALADDAIGLFLQYRDHHDHPEEQAQLDAVADVVEGEDAREALEPDQSEPTPTSQPRPRELAPNVPEAAAARGAWCSYLEYSAERGTVLGYGHVVTADGTDVLIRREDARQIELFLRLWPQDARQEEPYVRVPRSSVDFQPLRREGEPPWQVRDRLHLGAKRGTVRQVGDVVLVLKTDLMGRWGVAEQGVVTEVLGPDDKYAYAVTFAGQWDRPEFLGGGPAPRVYYSGPTRSPVLSHPSTHGSASPTSRSIIRVASGSTWMAPTLGPPDKPREGLADRSLRQRGRRPPSGAARIPGRNLLASSTAAPRACAKQIPSHLRLPATLDRGSAHRPAPRHNRDHIRDIQEAAMLSDDAGAIVDQVTRTADYEALREVANQLAGLLVARQRAAGTREEAQAWRHEHRALRARLDEIQPGTLAVAEALQEWSGRVEQLRRDAA